MRPRWLICWVGCALCCAGCADDPQALLVSAEPLNRATLVDTATQPSLRFGAGATLDPSAHRVVLYDVTGGARLTVAGGVELWGTRVTYVPQSLLLERHDYELRVEREAVKSALDAVDATEAPDELLAWPYVLRLRTGSRPRVRCAYLEAGADGAELEVRFSQPMAQQATGEQIRVSDVGGRQLTARAAIWRDEQTARLRLTELLDPAGLYVLQVGSAAAAADGVLLDGDDDGRVGPGDDGFSVRFTGSQRVILSRLR